MKSLMFLCGLVAVLGATTLGCGPQQPYCKDNSVGQCIDSGSGPPPGDDAGTGLGGESIILGGAE
jgi:hypothetical protein